MQNKCCKIVQKCVFMRWCDPFSFATCRFILFFPIFPVVLSTLLSAFVCLKLIKNFSHWNYINLLCRSTNSVFCHTRLFKRTNKYLGHRFSPDVWCGKVFAAVLCIVSSLLDNLASEEEITFSISNTIITNFPFNQTEMCFLKGLLERLPDCLRIWRPSWFWVFVVTTTDQWVAVQGNDATFPGNVIKIHSWPLELLS